jgi:hypothetical protein
MPKRNGYEVEPGARWLFVGSRRNFPEGPEEVEVVDLQRGEVRVRFVEGRLAGKSEWHRPARLYAPVEHVEEVRRDEEHYWHVRTRELPDVERRAVSLVGGTWSGHLLSGDYWAGSDPERVSELLGVALEEIARPGMGVPSQHEPGQWHLFGTHQRHLARRLCQRYPHVVHDHATLNVARDFTRLAYRQNYRGKWYLDLPRDEDHPMVEWHRQPYLVVCSWCHVGEPVRAPRQARAALAQMLKQYRATGKVPVNQWSGLPQSGKSVGLFPVSFEGPLS